MTVNVSSPVTGSAQTGLTSPTYTLVADQAPDVNGRAYAVSALGGTQTGVEVSSASNPFTLLFTRPKTIRSLPALLANGQLPSVPKNTYTVSVRKGVDVLSGQPKQVMLLKAESAVPAGADVADPESVRAAWSLFIGALSQAAVSSGIGDTCVQGVL
jgi:hypothetical protein